MMGVKKEFERPTSHKHDRYNLLVSPWKPVVTIFFGFTFPKKVDGEYHHFMTVNNTAVKLNQQSKVTGGETRFSEVVSIDHSKMTGVILLNRFDGLALYIITQFI